MATAPLRVSAPQSPYRDCDIAVLEPVDPTEPAKAICTDAATGLVIGSPSISPDPGDVQQDVTAEEVIRMIGGTYRLASIAVEIGTKLLDHGRRKASGHRNRCRLACALSFYSETSSTGRAQDIPIATILRN